MLSNHVFKDQSPQQLVSCDLRCGGEEILTSSFRRSTFKDKFFQQSFGNGPSAPEKDRLVKMGVLEQVNFREGANSRTNSFRIQLQSPNQDRPGSGSVQTDLGKLCRFE